MRWTRKAKVICFIVFFCLLVFVVVKQVIYKTHAEVEELTASFIGNSKEFKAEIENNSGSLTTNSIAELDGVITDWNDDSIMLDELIYCQFKDASILSSVTKNQSVTIKGRYIGYDDLLEEVKLDQCLIIQTK